MCLIIRRPRSFEIPAKLLANAFQNNSDGFGYMFAHKGNVHVRKFMARSAEDIVREYDKIRDYDVGIHFRMATHGLTNKDNCHPFQILRKDKHGRDLWLMHNGVLTQVPTPNERKSDTWHFARDWLRPLLAEDPDLMDDPGFQKMLERFIGTGNKLLLLNDEGKFYTINEDQGTTIADEGVWLSNLYSLDGPRSYRSYLYGGYGDYGLQPLTKDGLADLLEDEYPLGGACAVPNRSDSGEIDADEPIWGSDEEDDAIVGSMGFSIRELAELSETEMFNWVIEHPEQASDALRYLVHGRY